VTLQRQGIPVRIFKVDRYGAPPYPELILTTSRHTLDTDPGLVHAVVDATRRGYAFTEQNPAKALDDLLAADPALDRAEQQEQLQGLLPDLHPDPFDPAVLHAWAAWDLEHGLLQRPLDVDAAFDLSN
jgi:NitT/TauT family transport system substrate-binding protein/putative hydroxymethylpyrimidine transport system substrate-binding protein